MPQKMASDSRGSFSPLQDEHDKPIGVVVTIDDMTERRMLERRMARTEQLAALGELSAGRRMSFAIH